ncbi:MAG TPA: cysteine--tRNA ligase [Acidiferrobacterales bacterium]|nr:cysteine--tRNA ligase [Acidiferrobacterales bacterium]
MLSIYNSLTKRKQSFTPIQPGRVRMYVCGMTVYDYCHLGHARVMVVFDMVARYLRARGYQVTYVRNITDIDDKIIKRAHDNGERIDQLTQRFIQAMHEDAAALGALPPDAEPRATAFLPDIVDMIVTLINKGYAYAGDNGDVYYRVRQFPNYGALSGKSLDSLQVGTRVEADLAKRDPLDFVLWKAAKPGEPSWDSPWGKGRPGWHIECSAMSTACLGHHFDIHGGGMDLQFPHHENEIAQSEAATGEKFVNVWMHNGFVRVDDEKMSKSLGNFFTVRDVLKKYREPEAVRYFILNSHYRSPLDYSDANLRAAKSALDGLYIALRGLTPESNADGGERESRFHAAMADDFNTPKAFAELAELGHAVNRAKSAGDMAQANALSGVLRRLGGIVGLLQSNPEEYLKGNPGRDITALISGVEAKGIVGKGAVTTANLSDEIVAKLIIQRAEARKNKNWAESDRIRDELKAHGVIVEDTAADTTWRRE